ncbi:hypothetical protein [Methylobacillus flagellatus]|uniref:hypothetical protein n=1 Tax=Methylobacillus flagellatus TaxID=405 RepID=UPI0010F52A8B|nr:hypothetical protein [Methylobacillus flagellatus]
MAITIYPATEATVPSTEEDKQLGKITDEDYNKPMRIDAASYATDYIMQLGESQEAYLMTPAQVRLSVLEHTPQTVAAAMGTWKDTTTGLGKTENGQMFLVPTADPDKFSLFERIDAATATLRNLLAVADALRYKYTKKIANLTDYVWSIRGAGGRVYASLRNGKGFRFAGPFRILGSFFAEAIETDSLTTAQFYLSDLLFKRAADVLLRFRSSGGASVFTLKNDGHLLTNKVTATTGRFRTLEVNGLPFALAGVYLTPTKNIYGFGDSMLTDYAGQSGLLTALQALYGTTRTIYKNGIGGQISDQIVARLGGTRSLVTLTGNQIPESGAVDLTSTSIELITAGSLGSVSFTGSINGIHGTLTYVPGPPSKFTFTRTTPGAAQFVPPQTPFLLDDFGQGFGTLLLRMGRNDIGDILSGSTSEEIAAIKGRILKRYAEAVAYQKPVKKQYITFGIALTANEGMSATGTNALRRSAILEVNAEIKAAYQDSFYDPNVYLASLADTGSTEDMADVADGRIPTRFYRVGESGLDPFHFTPEVFAIEALEIKRIMDSLGY